MAEVTRAAEVAAALERWSQSVTYHQSRAAGDALAALLRESQPVTAPVVGDDEALLAVLDAAASHLIRTQDFELAQGVQEAATRLTAALADVARLESSPSRYEDLMAIEQLQTQVDHYRKGMIAARAALAAAVVDAERLRADFPPAPPLPTVDCQCRTCRRMIEDQLRARAGRNDG